MLNTPRRRPALVILLLMLPLRLLTGCDDSSGGAGDGRREEANVKATGEPAPPEALAAIVREYRKHWAPRGKSWFADVHGVLYEMTEVEVVFTQPAGVGPAERANGISARRFVRVQGAARHYDPARNGWSEWRNEAPGTGGSADYDYLIDLKDGDWVPQAQDDPFRGAPCDDPDAWIARHANGR